MNSFELGVMVGKVQAESDEIKKYDSRQPRDDHGRWSDGAGGISHGHAAHVMKSEGISDAHAAGVLAKIKDGTHKTREDVLAHIDSIHAGGGATSKSPELMHPKDIADKGYFPFDGNLNRRVWIAKEGENDQSNHQQVILLAMNKGKPVNAAAVDEYGFRNHLPENYEKQGDVYAPKKQASGGDGGAANGELSEAMNEAMEKGAARLKAGDEVALHGQTAIHRISSVTAHGVALNSTTGNSSLVMTHDDFKHRAIRMTPRLKQAMSRKSDDVFDFTDEPDELKTTMNELESMDADDTLVSLGGEIKSLAETESGWKFGGYLVVFDSPDVSNLRDRFTKSTDFDFEDGDTRSIYYNHGLDGTFAKTRIGKGKLFLKDAGVWFEGEVTKRRDYLEKHIERVAEGLKMTVETKGIQAPLFGLSSGALSHLVERERVGDGHVIGKWNLGECSITPCPAEPMTGVCALKSLAESTPEFDDEIKKYDSRQARDDHGRWSDGSGGISAGHAAHVMKSEGISDEHAEGVLAKIKDGTHKSREDVLAHIDSIHAGQGTAPPQTLHEAILTHLAEKGGRNGGEIARDLGVDRKEVLSALDELRTAGHTEKNNWNRDEITHQGRVAINGEKPPSDTQISSGEVTMTGGFESPVVAASGSRVYGKRMNVDAVNLRVWNPREGGEPRVYINGIIEGGTSAQRGGYDLGHLRYEGDNIVVGGGKDTQGNEHGIPEGAHRDRIHAIAKQMLNRVRDGRKSLNPFADTFTDEPDELKYLSTLETGQSDGGSRFVDHTSRLLDAVGEYAERVQNMTLTNSNRKSGKVISAANMERLRKCYQAHSAVLSDLKDLLDTHDDGESDEENSEAEKSVDEAFDSELMDLEIAQMRQRANLACLTAGI